MEPEFWHQRWAKHEIGFHLPEANPHLVRHFETLGLTAGARVFVPLCGKTRDIAWLLSRGLQVAGAELSEVAIRELFAELGVNPTVAQAGSLLRYSANDIEIFVGDIFALNAALLGPVDAVYDRAALIALPATMRPQYVRHLATLAGTAPQLLICFEYDQSQMQGPPFSVSEAEVRAHYEKTFHLTQLVRQPVEGGFRGKLPAEETVWLLGRR